MKCLESKKELETDLVFKRVASEVVGVQELYDEI